MAKLFLWILLLGGYSLNLMAQNEGQARMVPLDALLYFSEEKKVEMPAKKFEETTPKTKVRSVKIERNEVKILSRNSNVASANKHITLKRNLKASSIVSDSLLPRKNALQKLGCFLREPLDLISLGVEMFELTKPPKSPFLIILYVIYIVPLFAIITSFIIGGILGLTSFILACGLFAFLLYWLLLVLLGFALVGNFLLWGIIGAFAVGLVLYLLLIGLC
jgi:hypothetical protein